jgi:hypothetical protein
MSRSGYSDDLDEWAVIRWRGAVASAIRGKRGQAFLREMAAAMDAMPDKHLIGYDIADEYGSLCAIGSVARARGRIDIFAIDPTDRETIANVFDISPALVAEIAYENDEMWYSETPAHRWQRMRKWIDASLLPEAKIAGGKE